MTDREILELAAKAAGYIPLSNGEFYDPVTECEFIWEPLTDREEAFSLMVKLKMTVSVSCSINGGFAFVDATAYHLFEHAEVEDQGPADQAEALTMRAITRCAAEVGRAMG